MEPLTLFFITLLGLEFGSFANVCIYRWPRNSSILHPRRSHCTWCRKEIAWHDNIPVLSFLFLKGRCRHCTGVISLRYPLVELLMPFLWLAVIIPFQSFFAGQKLFTLLICYTLFIVIVTTFADLDWKIIPNEATYSLAVAALALSPFNPLLGGETGAGRLLQGLYGGLTGAGLLLLVSFVGRYLFKREAMGGGDIKLLGALGIVLGVEGVLTSFFIASIVGGLFVTPLLLIGKLKRHSYLPFGPFLNIGALGVLFFLLKKIA